MANNNEFEEGYLRRVIVHGDISERTSISFLKQVSVLEHIDPSSEIQVWISSYGGSVAEAFSMLDVMKACSCPIKTVGIGKIMSAAVLLLSAGDKGNRFMAPNARLMTHQVSGGNYGSTKDMEVFTNEIVYQQNKFFDLLSFYTGQSKEKLLADITSDKYISAEDAVKEGFIDAVLPYSKNKASPPVRSVKKTPAKANKKAAKKKR